VPGPAITDAEATSNISRHLRNNPGLDY